MARTGTNDPMLTGTSPRLFGAAALILLQVGCRPESGKIWKESKIVMGTVVEVTVAHRSEDVARSAIKDALAELQRIDDLTSNFKPESVISKLNRSAPSARVPVGEEVFRILREAVEVSRASDGAFDVTIWPVSRLWDFQGGGRIPDAKELAGKLALVGYRNIELGPSGCLVCFKVDGTALDLGAIAKGWAVDRAIEKIVARGVRSAIVDAGGDLRVVGARPGRDFWRIGVQHPRNPGALLLSLELKDTAIVTSGDYERFFISGGVRYHHILDPATGQPAAGCQSVTVLAPTASEADACATAAFVLGPSRGIAFLRSRSGVRGLIVGADGELSWTDEGLARMARR